jgi:hypothetical protein
MNPPRGAGVLFRASLRPNQNNVIITEEYDGKIKAK